MFNKELMKQQNGSISVYAIAMVLCFTMILGGIFFSSKVIRTIELKTLLKIKDVYIQDDNTEKIAKIKSDRNLANTSGYVKNGLVVFYDAINNMGSSHSNNAKVWRDLSGNGNDAIYSGSGELTWNDKAYDFVDPANNYFVSKKAISLGNKSRTIEVVCSLEEDGVENIIGFGSNTSGALNDIIYYNKGINLNNYNDTDAQKGINSEFKLGKTYSNTITYDSTTKTATYYTDANSKKNVAIATALNTTSGALQIGRGINSAHNKNKRLKIQAIRIYNRVLTKEERKQNYELDKARYEVKEVKEVKVKLADGTEKVLTKENYGEHLGKVVTNYTGAPTTVQGTTVSNKYRLYYVDFDGKYGEKNTIYLKADCTGNNKALTMDTTSADDANVKIKQLNPGLYKDASGNAITSPVATNNNMKAVTWLTNAKNWDSLKTGVNVEIADKINYVVGAPSLEMMVDSYNACYADVVENVSEPTATGERNANSARVKLFYQYPYSRNTYKYGYGVGPGKTSAWNTYTDGYYTVQAPKTGERNVGNMYYASTSYWLASPCAYGSNYVMWVNSYKDGSVNYNAYNLSSALCPLVSLKSDALLELDMVKVKLADGTEKVLTKENYGAELGKVVTNYTGAPTTVQGTTVSNTYRLYYIDFDGKYGPKSTIYLKADCTSNNKALTLDTTSADATTVKLKELNPGLYNAKDSSGNAIKPPAETNDNMQAVTWLTNTTKWETLKTGVNAEIADKINYVVGAPSLEMMMDSYNAHYGLTGDTPNTSTLSASTKRVKLFYKYPYNTSNYGYGVGPSNSSSAINGYYTQTSNYSVKTSEGEKKNIDSMYYPGSNNNYWLASPSATRYNNVMLVCNFYYGAVSYSSNGYSGPFAFCPLVSIKSDALLQLGT